MFHEIWYIFPAAQWQDGSSSLSGIDDSRGSRVSSICSDCQGWPRMILDSLDYFCLSTKVWRSGLDFEELRPNGKYGA